MKYILSLFCIWAFFGTPTLKSAKYFVGYMGGEPVFECSSEKSLYVWHNDRFYLVCNYSSLRNVIFVKDSLICYHENENAAIVAIGGKEHKYSHINNLTYSATDKNQNVYFTDIETLDIKYLENGKIHLLGIKGYVVDITNDNLYFTKAHDKNIIHANADLFRYNLISKKTDKMLSNISGEYVRISADETFIYDQILKNGKFIPFLYNIQSKTFTSHTINEDAFPGGAYFWNDSLIYYNPETMATKAILLK